MCEVANLKIAHAFRNIINRPKILEIQALMARFGGKAAIAFRNDPRFSGCFVNAHRLQERAAEVVAEFSQSIKLGSFDRIAFEERLAQRIKEKELFLARDVRTEDILSMIGSLELAGELAKLSGSPDLKIVRMSGMSGKEIEEHMQAADRQAEQIRSGLGLDSTSDPDLCG